MTENQTADTVEALAEAVGTTPEGILAGRICSLIAQGAESGAAIPTTFLCAAKLIRDYGDERVKEFRSAH